MNVNESTTGSVRCFDREVQYVGEAMTGSFSLRFFCNYCNYSANY